MKIPKVRAAILAGLLVLVSASAYADDGSKCWKEGWKKGYCDAKGLNSCIAPFPPFPPFPPFGRQDCQSRFADGYTTGLGAGRR